MYDYMFYGVEEYDGEKCVHYLIFTVENGECPDDYTDEEYEASGETSIDVVELTGMYISLDDLRRLRDGGYRDYFDLREAETQQYMFRYIEHLGIKYIGELDEAEHLRITDVDESTPCGEYWCEGWWTWRELA